MFAQERQKIILEILKEKNSIEVKALTKLLKVSSATIRRDLGILEKNESITRTYGGAMKIDDRILHKKFSKDKNVDKKTLMAEVAKYFISDGDCILLDSGGTTLELSKKIKDMNLTIITNSNDIAYELSNNDNLEVIITGGFLDVNSKSMTGNITESSLRNFRIDKIFLEVNGVSIEYGITCLNYLEAQTKKVMINQSKKVIVLAESDKFEKGSLGVICSIEDVDMIITDNNITKESFKKYEDVGVNIISKIN